MKSLSTFSLLLFSIFLSSCNEDSPIPINQIIIDGEVFKLSLENSRIDVYGPSGGTNGLNNTHYVYQFVVWTEDQSRFFAVQLRSLGTDGFNPGNYSFDSDHVNNDYNYFGYIESTIQDFGSPIGGNIKVKKSNEELGYSLEFNVQLENGKTLKGYFSGPFGMLNTEA